jgi:hypothetical protein
VLPFLPAPKAYIYMFPAFFLPTIRIGFLQVVVQRILPLLRYVFPDKHGARDKDKQRCQGANDQQTHDDYGSGRIQ